MFSGSPTGDGGEAMFQTVLKAFLEKAEQLPNEFGGSILGFIRCTDNPIPATGCTTFSPAISVSNLREKSVD